MTIEKAGCVSAFRPLFGCKPYVYLQGSPYAHLQVFFPCPTFIYNTFSNAGIALLAKLRLTAQMWSARAYYFFLPVNGSSNSISNCSASLSSFSWFWIYSAIFFVFFPTVST